MDKNTITKILETAVYAPSGDNSQPWHFEVGENFLDVFNLPNNDNPLLNFRQRGSYIAHGALLENILTLSSNHGQKATYEIFPDDKNCEHILRISFEPSNEPKNELGHYIKQRATNRKSYKDIPLPLELKNSIIDSTAQINKVGVVMVEDASRKKSIGTQVSMNEVVMLEENEICKSFFDRVVWSKEEENKKKMGLYIPTCEFNLIQKLVFWLYSKPKVASILNKIGVARFIAKQNAKLYSSGSALGAIIIPGTNSNDKDYIEAGRMLERIWLIVTSKKWSLHPLAGITFFAQQVFAEDTKNLSQEHIEITKKAYERLKEAFSVEKNTIAFIFRIGDGGSPSAYSSKKSPSIIFK